MRVDPLTQMYAAREIIRSHSAAALERILENPDADPGVVACIRTLQASPDAMARLEKKERRGSREEKWQAHDGQRISRRQAEAAQVATEHTRE